MATPRGQESLYLGEETAPVRLPKRLHAAAREHCYRLLIAEVREQVRYLKGQIALVGQQRAQGAQGRVSGLKKGATPKPTRTPESGREQPHLQQESKPPQRKPRDRTKAKGFG